MKRLISLLIIVFSSATVWAQSSGTDIRGEIYSSDGKAIGNGEVTLLQNDTIAAAAITNPKGRFEIKDLPAGDYVCHIFAYGYKDKVRDLSVRGERLNLPRIILQKDSVATLGELTVTADQRLRTKEMAGMSVYYLTDRAKKEPNAYRALIEIPRLRVNEADRSVTLDDGTVPLILVNGVRKPLDVLSPEFIESVEVIDNPPARYKGDSEVTSVLNIKLRKEGSNPYFRANLGGNVSMPDANFFYTSASVETGTATSSLYLTGGYMQFKNQQYDSHSVIRQGNIRRDRNSIAKNYWRNPFVILGGDKEFSKKDYMAFSVKYCPNPSGGTTRTDGEIADLESGKSSGLTSFNDSKTRYHELASNLYYKHAFTDSRILEIDGGYFYSNNGNSSDYEEKSELLSYVSAIDQDNSRHMGKIDAVYSDMLTRSMHLEAGSNTEYSVTNIDDRLDEWPNFRYRRTREYLFAGIDNNRSQSKFNYMVSLGLDMVFSDADGVRNSYVDFVPSVSLAYKFSGNHMINLNYNRSRQMPSAGNLNPRNTSTNILTVNMGNPFLKPSHTDNVKLGYVFSKRGLRVNPYVRYINYSDQVMPYGYMEDDNVYVSTLQNLGHISQIQAGGMVSYNFPQKNGFFGNVSANAFYNKMYMKDMAFRGSSVYATIQGFVGYRNVSFNAYIGYNGQSYSLYSKTGDSFNSNLSLNWDVSNSVSLQLMAEKYICPRRASKTWMVNGDYESFTSSVQKTLAPKIQIGVWYTFQTKNFKWRNKRQLNNEDGELKTVTVK